MNLSAMPNPTALAGASGADRRTLKLIFAHPVSHDLAWLDAVTLIRQIGTAEERYNDWFLFQIGDEKCDLHKPFGKHMSRPDVLELRRLMERAGWAPTAEPDGTTVFAALSPLAK